MKFGSGVLSVEPPVDDGLGGVAFGVDPADYKASNAYVISEQGKPPDFALEIASRRDGRIDVTDSGGTTPRWTSGNTGGLTRRGSITVRGWWTGCTLA